MCIRDRLLPVVFLCSDKANKENLEAIERCSFVLCLDSSTPESLFARSLDGASVSERPQRGDVSLAEQMIHGHGSGVNSANRWFEKTMQVNKAFNMYNSRTASICMISSHPVHMNNLCLFHHRHGQDKTVLSYLVRVGGVNRIGDKTRQFCLVLTQFPIYNCSVSNILRTTAPL